MYKGIAFKFPRNKSSLEQRCGSEARQVSALQQIIFYTEMRFDRNSSNYCSRQPVYNAYVRKKIHTKYVHVTIDTMTYPKNRIYYLF